MADETSVATRTSVHRIMAPRWTVIRHVLAGTEAMRAAGQAFLPRHQEESLPNYQDRLNGTVLVNTTELVLDTLVGRVFKVPLDVEDDVPAPVAGLLDDVDLTGTGLNPFCREWFQEGLACGVSHVLVDMQAPDWEPPPGVTRTLADDREDGLRPYWYRISPESVVAAFAQRVNGREVLTHVRVAEHHAERVGWTEQHVLRIRVLEPDHWELWEPVDLEKQDPEDEWHKVQEGPNSLGFIPLVTFYTGIRDGQPFVVKPPLLDLAYLNVAHWQSSSDQRSILTVSRFPILAVSGVDGDDASKMKIGPREWLSTPDPHGKWYYVEHTGRAIAAGERDMSRLEDQMASYGAEFLRAKPGTKSATERLLDEGGTISPLEAMALDFQDALKLVLDITATWQRTGDRLPNDPLLADGGTINVIVDTSGSEADQISLEALFRARAARDISRRAYLTEMQARKILDEDFDHDADLEELKSEPEFGMPAASMDAPVAAPGAPSNGSGQDTPGANKTPSKASSKPLPNVTQSKGGSKLPASKRRSAIAGRKA